MSILYCNLSFAGGICLSVSCSRYDLTGGIPMFALGLCCVYMPRDSFCILKMLFNYSVIDLYFWEIFCDRLWWPSSWKTLMKTLILGNTRPLSEIPVLGNTRPMSAVKIISFLAFTALLIITYYQGSPEVCNFWPLLKDETYIYFQVILYKILR